MLPPFPPPDVVTTPEFIKEALRDAVQDFEQCLQRSKDDRLLSTSTPRTSKVLQRFDLIEDASKVAKFNTFPRSLSSPEDNMGGGGGGQRQPQQGRYSMEIISAWELILAVKQRWQGEVCSCSCLPTKLLRTSHYCRPIIMDKGIFD